MNLYATLAIVSFIILLLAVFTAPDVCLFALLYLLSIPVRIVRNWSSVRPRFPFVATGFVVGYVAVAAILFSKSGGLGGHGSAALFCLTGPAIVLDSLLIKIGFAPAAAAAITFAAAVAQYALLGLGFDYLLWKRRNGPDRCQACGYRLRGLREQRCPECGTPFVPITPATGTPPVDSPRT